MDTTATTNTSGDITSPGPDVDRPASPPKVPSTRIAIDISNRTP